MVVAFNAAVWLVDRHLDEGRAGRVAYVSTAGAVTYAELAERVRSASSGLRALGVHPEERVALLLPDSVEFVVAFLATMRIGAVALPINPLLPTRDVAAILATAGARVCCLVPDHAATLPSYAPDVATWIVVGSPTPSHCIPSHCMTWSDVLAQGSESRSDAASTVGESPGFWLCTSGTTGQPKLAMHRHIDLRIIAEGYAHDVLRLGPTDIMYSTAPMFHTYGLGNTLSFPLSVGAAAVLEPTRPRPTVVRQLLIQYRPTVFCGVPAVFASLLAAPLAADDFHSVRCASSAGEALPEALFHAFRDRFDVEILDGMGTTEMTHIFLSNYPGRVVPGTSGTPVPGHEVRLLDPDGIPVPDGEPGALWVRGDAAATGYWADPATTRERFVGRWYRTGDIYVRNPDGTYRYFGREDDLMKVVGEWVSPAEVEQVLGRHRAIAEAAVVGSPDVDGLVRPLAYVVLREGVGGVGEIIEHCRQHLVGYKVPRDVIVVDELPRTPAMSKLHRAALRHREPSDAILEA